MELNKTRSLVQPLVSRAMEEPGERSVVFISEEGDVTEVSAAQFHEAAMAYARILQEVGIRRGDLVVLVLRHSTDLLTAFWGAIYLGAIPSIFPYLTEKLDPDIYMERVKALVIHSGTNAVITFPEFKDALARLVAEFGCQVLSTDELPVNPHQMEQPTLPDWSSHDIAFLQHSSGTTGLQKGVALSHQAVLNQLRAYSQAIQVGDSDVIVSWLPLYHDMGLIAGFVLPLVLGIPLVLLSPFHWVRRPAVLFQAIHDYGGTLTWLPNFAYNHCVRSIRVREVEHLDLSRWRATINCSEPVYHDSHRQFLNRFGPYGFQASALATSYAMAENTFAVTQSRLGQPPPVDWVSLVSLQEENRAIPVDPEALGATPIVSCGFPIQGTEVRISDGNGHPLPERYVGEVVIRSNCMLSEYFRRPGITAEAIRDSWYFTGDMGYLAEGELYITGRKKDLIIVGGKNIYPQDIEAIANRIPGIHPGRAVAFGIPDERLGTESIVVVAELEATTDAEGRRQLEGELRRCVVAETEVTLADVKLVDGRWLIKTSSGKLARNENRNKYLSESDEKPA